MRSPTPPRKTATRADPLSDLRIIGGRFRGRKLSFPALDGLRPTGDRIRETLFNWLAPDLPQSRCLDLFAGSGALGFESLSRGADFVLMLEKHPHAHQSLVQNLQKLAIENAQILLNDSLRSLAQKPALPFDIAYLDPPFSADLWQAAAELLESNEWLTPDACIYVELPKDHPFIAPRSWRLHRDKIAGAVSYRLYYRHVTSETEIPD